MREFVSAALVIALAVVLWPGVAAARGGFPGGAWFHGAGGTAVMHKTGPAKAETAPVISIHESNFSPAHVDVPSRQLTYPSLSSPRCADSNGQAGSCVPPASASIGGNVQGPQTER